MRKWVLLCLLLCASVTLSAQTVICVGAPESRLVVGERARVVAAGGSNLRAVPAAGTQLITIVPQNTIVPVIDGPFCAGGYAWWQIDYDDERGWVAEGVDDFYWLAPYVIQRVQIGTVRLEAQPDFVTDIRLSRERNPLSSQFVFEGYPVTTDVLLPFIVVFDQQPETLRTDIVPSQQMDLDTGGNRFVDLYFDDMPMDTDDFTLVYRYRQVLADGRYIDGYFPVTAPNLPLTYTPPRDDADARITYDDIYFEQTQLALDALTAEDFTPPLAQLDTLVRSIQPNAPVEESDVFTFSNDDIQLVYHPLLATNITRLERSASENLPAHTELVFADYPYGTGSIRIYETANLDSTLLSQFQQTLTRQPSNPPRIPVPSQADAPLSREDVMYLTFASGTGIRYLASFDADTQVYSFQGITDNGAYVVSALLELNETNALPLSIFDAMMTTLELRTNT